ncbi:MAG: quinone-dependent dihydroorotate dehydrogenase [Bdellovibrio sp.]
MGVRFLSDLESPISAKWKPFTWKGVSFSNRLGIAGGVDKNADLVTCWPKLGFGFAEIGTVTPRPQNANPGTIVDRDWDAHLLWNKMGFPNDGQWDVRARLESAGPQSIPLFLNVGKNRDTPAEKAHEDYAEVARTLSPYVDAIVLNVSSPNTQGLRSLQSKDSLGALVRTVALNSFGKPILVKFSPDEDETALAQSLDVAASEGANGFVLTNTTVQRPPNSGFPETGGLSGRFLQDLSKKSLKVAVRHFKNAVTQPLLVSAGGVLSPADVIERLDLGADLVQVYAALVFEGPTFARQTASYVHEKGLQ